MSQKFTNSDIIGFFLADASEHLQAINDDLLALEKNQKDLTLIDKIFRAVHAIKGSAGMSGFFVVSQVAHKVEDLLGKLREHALEVSEEIIDLLFQGVDTLSHQIDNIANGHVEDESALAMVTDLYTEFLGTDETQPETRSLQQQPSVSEPSQADLPEDVAKKITKSSVPPRPKRSAIEAAEQYITQNQFDKAFEIYRKILQKSSSNSRVRQRFEEAKALQTYLQSNP